MVAVLTTIAVTLLVLIAGVLIFILTRPDSFRLERSAQIAAPAQVVFPLIDDFHEWTRWSPWEKLDPNMTKTFGGPARGVGSTYYWNGNQKAGEGRMTILESNPDEHISIKLEFMKPFKSTNQAIFRLTPGGSGTNVNWIMTGNNNFVGKMFYPFMDKAVGKDFEQGLANLNSVATGPQAH
jgi:hypothetical protein